MPCNKCLSYVCGDDDIKFMYLTGHHSSCPDFAFDITTFIDQFDTAIELIASQKISNKVEELVALKNSIGQAEDNLPSSSKLIKHLYLDLMGKYHPIVPNIYLYNWESDLLALNRNSKYITEYEIKISRTDFKADFKKENKHQLILDCFSNKSDCNSIPNYFYYVTPTSLIKIEDIPSYAGLIEVGSRPRIIKRAPILHKNKMTDDIKFQLLEKAYYKFWNKFMK